MENLKSILERHPFCKGLESRYLDILAGCCSNVRFEPGQFLFHLGEESNRMFIIRKGKVAIEVDPPGRGPITIQTLGEGEIIGWSWLAPPYKFQYDAQAVESTLAIAFDGKCLREKCDEDHGLGYELLNRLVPVMSQRIQAARMQLLDLYGSHAR